MAAVPVPTIASSRGLRRIHLSWQGLRELVLRPAVYQGRPRWE